MEMKKRKIYEEKEVTMYVAFDGKEFDQMSSCEAYEEELTNKLLDESPDVVKCSEAEGCMPFGGSEYSENNIFKWVKPLNEKGVELLNNLYGYSSCSTFDTDDIGKWICLEISDDDVYCCRLEDNLKYVKSVCQKLKVSADALVADDSCFSDKEYDYILDFANSGTFDYEDNSDLKTLRVLWTAYCLHKDYDADTANYDSGVSKIFSKLGEKTSDFEEKGFERFDRYMCKYLV